jgi:hypothetical protein
MFVGREHEIAAIRERLADRSKAQLLILYGRRRIGKSRLIAEATKLERRKLLFEGIEGAPSSAQVVQFTDDLARQTRRVRLAAASWRDAFSGLGEVVRTGRWVVVFDEFPWMGAGRTRIVAELKLHWDRWSANPELALIVCGSVASFMTQHVVHSKALHNRKTLEMCLGPLSPRETGLFFARRSAHERAQLYMSLGGVPKYLEQVSARHSLAYNLNRLAFTQHGFFVQEFETLFKEQFRAIKTYEAVVRALAQGPKRLPELERFSQAARGGGFQSQIANLVNAQFVRQYRPVAVGRKPRARTMMYKLADPFLSFYFRYIHEHRDLIARNRSENLFRAIAGPTLDQYWGYAWERLCEDALAEICGHLRLSLADIDRMGPYFQQGLRRGRGVQIDWLIVRRDGVWTVIEYKYTKTPIGTEVIAEVQEKIKRLQPPRHITVEPVLVSAAGARSTVDAAGYFARILTLADLV